MRDSLIVFNNGVLMKKNNLFTLTKIAALSLVLAPGSVFAEIDYYKLPLKDLTELAQKGDDRAQLELGFRYDEGNGVKKDHEKAIELYLKAEKQNNAMAQNNLGWAYHQGEGVKQDYTKAKEWYEKAIANKDGDKKARALAMNNLGDLYVDGLGVETNYDKALELRLESENLRPHSETEYKIGWLYGKKKDYKQAAEWYQKSAAQGDSWAQNNLGNLYRNGTGVAQDYKKAMELYQKSAAQGDSYAYRNIGHLYAEGQGVKRDDKKAFEYYTKALDAGNPYVYENLVDFYVNGRGVAKDEVKALKLMLQNAPDDATFEEFIGKHPVFNTEDFGKKFVCENKANAELLFNAGVRWGVPKEKNSSPEALIKTVCSNQK